jgi:RimJ/RimL family protein N-acetyltransferase
VAVIEPKRVLLKNGKEVCIRSPMTEDTSKVAEYSKKIFEDDRFFLTTAEEARERHTVEKVQDYIQKVCADPNQVMIVTEVDSCIVSMSHIECGGNKRTRHVGQMGLSILPNWRGIGLGTAILQAMIDWAAANPVIEKLTLGVWAANKTAIGLYEKMGFVEEGRKVREVKFADGSYDDMVCMYRFVR